MSRRAEVRRPGGLARALAIVAATAWHSAACADEAAPELVPEPLGLEQALVFASGHPRTQLASDRRLLYPVRRPLYLDCHGFAYLGTGGAEHRRSRALPELTAPEVSQQLAIMERFFDVLLADIAFQLTNEARAIAYSRYHRADARFELGQLSEIRTAERLGRFRQANRRRTAAQAAQRLTRSLLAQALGRPAQLTADLKPPRMPRLPAELPALEKLFDTALADNAYLAQLKQPLDAAERVLIDMELRQQLLELLLRLEILEAADPWLRSEANRRDLELERSRVLFEQEVTSDLGDSLVQRTRVRLQERTWSYCRLMAWARLGALQGRPVWPPSGNSRG